MYKFISYKIQKSTSNSIAFVYNNNKLVEKKIMKTVPFTIATKNEMSRNKFIQGSERSSKQNYKTLRKETEEDTCKKWKDLL